MNPTSIQLLTFPFPLHPGEIRHFRGAINELVGREATAFHNHCNEPDAPTEFVWDYPSIQYGVHKGRAAIRGIGPGAAALIRELLPQLLTLTTLSIGGEARPVTGFRMTSERWETQLADQPLPFGLHRWIALSKENYTAWKQLDGNDRARRMILERALTGHLRRQAALLAPEISIEAIEAEIIREDQRKKIVWHGVPLIGFNVVAKSRYLPPRGPGLGRLTAFGFGEAVGPERYDYLLRSRRMATDDAEEVL